MRPYWPYRTILYSTLLYAFPYTIFYHTVSYYSVYCIVPGLRYIIYAGYVLYSNGAAATCGMIVSEVSLEHQEHQEHQEQQWRRRRQQGDSDVSPRNELPSRGAVASQPAGGLPAGSLASCPANHNPLSCEILPGRVRHLSLLGSLRCAADARLVCVSAFVCGSVLH